MNLITLAINSGMSEKSMTDSSMYKDQNVAKYYDESLLNNYNVRYNLFIMVVACTGVIASIVPFILR